jgi:hypothetical protein
MAAGRPSKKNTMQIVGVAAKDQEAYRGIR